MWLQLAQWPKMSQIFLQRLNAAQMAEKHLLNGAAPGEKLENQTCPCSASWRLSCEIILKSRICLVGGAWYVEVPCCQKSWPPGPRSTVTCTRMCTELNWWDVEWVHRSEATWATMEVVRFPNCIVYQSTGCLWKRYFSDFRLISVLEVGFFFWHVFQNQNFEPVSSSHSNYIHSESKLPKKRMHKHDFYPNF